VSVVDSLVRGIIFEPTNAVSSLDDGGLSTIVTEADHTFFDGVSPDYLPEYLSDMASPETNLDDAGPTILLCQSVVNRPHRGQSLPIRKKQIRHQRRSHCSVLVAM
jgi:hypothetical protein